MNVSLEYWREEYPNKFKSGINEGHKKAIN